ncbi:radical SAM protein [Pseudothauera nasutitermitis]|uniref:Radical SAM protein n=1 Tax=Pseudothauera nasutitermitis TaxID=2565930 RepID=A0A4S4AZV0_9RHOO|nr:radical SAM protein [Pseudothauera nasutitermitis]THF65691.1 radical SAM protein [Pseudothauera nasutitermitis]
MRTAILERLRTARKPIVLSGAGIVGEQLIGLCRDLGIPIAGVCDGSVRVIGTDFFGHTVIPTAEVARHFPDPLVLISVAAIRDVVDLLAAQGIDDWVAAGPLLEGIDLAQEDTEIDFVKFSIESCITIHRAFLDPAQLFLRSVDLIITERCSLKCKDCSNLMQYYEQPRNMTVEEILHSIQTLCALADEIMEVRIIGGDAFMHKQWPEVVGQLVGEAKIKRIAIYTNGAIVPKDEQAALLQHPKVLLVVTDYGQLSRNMGPLRAWLAQHDVAHRILTVDSWLDCASIEKHNRPRADNVAVYQECCAKNMLTLSSGKLFRCPFAANADRLEAVPDLPGDYVNILDADLSSRDEMRRRIGHYTTDLEFLEICDYCAGRPLAGKEVPPAVQTSKPLHYIKYPRT